MRSSEWIDLLRLIPAERYSILMIMTADGSEFNVQNILRTQNEYLVVRARMAGTTDAGKVFFVPFDRIEYIGFREEIKEAEVQGFFPPETPAEREARLERAPAAPPPAGGDHGLPVPNAAVEGQPPVHPGAQGVQSSKAALLERLRRTRSHQDSPSPTR